jgi:hypothetical protein
MAGTARRCANPRFRVTVASLDGRSVTSPYSVRLLPRVAITSVKQADLIVVPCSGLDLDDQFQRHAALLSCCARRPRRRLHCRNLNRAGLSGRSGPPRRARGDHPLGDGGRVPPALSESQLAAGEAHYRGRVDPVQRPRSSARLALAATADEENPRFVAESACVVPQGFKRHSRPWLI